MNITEYPNNSARLVAVEVLNRFDKTQKRQNSRAQKQSAYASDILNELLDTTDQKQRATDLVMGTIRHHGSIDSVLSALADTPAKRVAPELINFLRVGLYELIYCPQTPEYSIINDAAENTKTRGGEKQVGFVNAVLRKIASRINARSHEITAQNIRQNLPQNTSVGCVFDRCFLADPQIQPADYFSTAYSISRFLINEWLDEFGYDKTRQICIASNRKAGIYLRPNTLKTSTYKLAELLTHTGLGIDITADDRMIKIDSPGNIMLLPGFEDGLFTVQDPTASLPAIAAEPKPQMKILDLCAAPGTKTIQLAELTNDKADIFATDINSSRLLMLDESIKRLSLNSIKTIPYEKLKEYNEMNEQFDIILLDVPCSNTGVLAKRPEVRLRLKPKSVEKLADTQDELLKSAADLVKPQGRICYSTCSIITLENQRCISEFLFDHPQFKLLKEKLTLPEDNKFDHDGGYYAILLKK
ncbi:MAG: methyltransferase domain-containing protein [Sedimentisphaerales bacterium]|nr:methyltransferase domain-containing protein [Sedimentisphaerales bacterium]